VPLVAGVDSSTQSTKVLVVDADSLGIVAVGHAPHAVDGGHGARETHPDVWWRALAAALSSTGLAGEIDAISVAGQQHGLVVTDDAGRPLRPAMLWNDTRAAPDASTLVRALGGPDAWAGHVGVVPLAAFTVSKWAWLRRVEPDVAAATVHVRLPHDWLTQQLTGAAVTDRGDASGTGWWSTHTEDYVERVLALPTVDLHREQLPEVLGPGSRAGVVSDTAAADLGLRPGIPVGAGTGDNMATALGLTADVGQPVMSLGTSGTVFTVAERPVADPTGRVAGFADATGRYLPLACTLNCTLAVDQVATWLGLDREDVADSTDVTVLPYFDGERTPNLPDATASIAGLTHTTTPQEILLATYIGAVQSLLDALALLPVADAAPLTLVGGGSRGKAWRTVVERLSGREVLVPELDELVAYGAARQAHGVLT
jgi:xylulokinase